MASDGVDLNDDLIARFQSRGEAAAAAAAAMPRRRHRRPFPQFVGAYDAWIVMAPSNIVLLKDGTMFDFVQKITIR